MVHELKMSPEDFQAVMDGMQTVILQQEDTRRFTEGDRLQLQEWTGWGWDGPAIPGRFTGRAWIVIVTHVLRDSQWLQPDAVALSIRWANQ